MRALWRELARVCRPFLGYHFAMAGGNDPRRDQLTAERERVWGQLSELGVSRDSFDEGFADSGQVTAERGEVEALVGTLRDTLNDIDAALAKFENGTYGRCEVCGGPIAEARLEAMPAARTCITCASRRR
jgi:RNA polymerase-binding transcription factor